MQKVIKRKDTKLYSQMSLFPTDFSHSVLINLFEKSPLGELKSVLPLAKLAIAISRKSCDKLKNKISNLGGGWFDMQGILALQFLKMYYNGISDEKLIEMLNGNWEMQMFCGIQLPLGTRIRDKDIVGRWRRFLAKYIDIDEFQRIFLTEWKKDIVNPETKYSDATCYESHVKYPTNLKLLWDSIEWQYRRLSYCSESLKLRKPRNNYEKVAKKYQSFTRTRQRQRAQKRSMFGRLLKLHGKLITQIEDMLRKYRKGMSHIRNSWSEVDDKQFKISKTINIQQNMLFANPDRRMPDRICSWAKPYLHPIMRGKETKSVEFGAFVNIVQVDQIQLIEHHSFKMYHEGNRLPYCVIKYQTELGKCEQIAGDQKYASDKNRKFCKKRGIQTSFRAKGPQPVDEQKIKDREIRKRLGTIRATRQEGRFGNDKNHYGLRKIKAKGEDNEMAWIFFGIFTSNAMQIVNKRRKKEESPPKNIPLPFPAKSKAA